MANPEDALIKSVDFEWEGTNHTLNAYISDNHADIDGGSFYLTLDSLGVIYVRSTTWPGIGTAINTNDDSLNQLIIRALVVALSEKHIRTYPVEPPPPPVNLNKKL